MQYWVRGEDGVGVLFVGPTQYVFYRLSKHLCSGLYGLHGFANFLSVCCYVHGINMVAA